MVNPILAEGLTYPYVKISSRTLIYKDLLYQCFCLIYFYGQGLLSNADLSLCATLLLTSSTLLFSPAIAFKKIALFMADMDM